jgi:FkbM family methyltransferase
MKHLLLRLLPYNTHLYNFCKSYIEKHDGDSNGDLITNGELRVMRQFLPESSVVFDVGAHIGEWSKLALSVNPGLNIHCFEPSRENFTNLTRNISSPNVTCNPFGLSSEKGERPLFIFRSAPGLHSLYQRRGLESGWGLKTPEETERVKLDTLENYCAERRIEKIDFLKVDVEGHELEVFKGGRSLFEENRVRMVQFEYGGCNIDSKVLLKDIFEFFAGMNYSFYKIFPEMLKPYERYDQRLENFKYQNWLMINEKFGSIPRDKGSKVIAPEKSLMERSRLSAREAALVNDLRREILVMPEPTAVTDSAAEAAWLANREKLRKCILEEDPREFLTWDVVTGSMFVGNRPFIDHELGYLMSRPDWKRAWEDILEEDFAGDPKPYKGYRQSSGNRIHQAYHLARFEQETGLSVSRFPLIVEFGGGYGSLCRLIHKLGFKGQYIIFDLPEFVALQKFYLGSLAMPLIEAKDVSSGRPGILCESDLDLLGSVTTQVAQTGLFIATWSLSETDSAFRERVVALPAVDKAAAYLIAYQDDFEGVDNPRFFDAWRGKKPTVRWMHSEISHMPGNFYLFGRRVTS